MAWIGELGLEGIGTGCVRGAVPKENTRMGFRAVQWRAEAWGAHGSPL